MEGVPLLDAGFSAHPLLHIEDGVGIVRMQGPLIRRPDPIERWHFGAVDTEEVIEALRKAVGSASARAILLDIDSPGGR